MPDDMEGTRIQGFDEVEFPWTSLASKASKVRVPCIMVGVVRCMGHCKV